MIKEKVINHVLNGLVFYIIINIEATSCAPMMPQVAPLLSVAQILSSLQPREWPLARASGAGFRCLTVTGPGL